MTDDEKENLGMISGSMQRAICASHSSVKSALKSIGESISDPSEPYDKSVRAFLPHVKSVLENWNVKSFTSIVPSTASHNLLELFKFLMRAQIYLGRFIEVSQLCDVRYRLLVEVHRSDAASSSVSEPLRDIGTVFI